MTDPPRSRKTAGRAASRGRQTQEQIQQGSLDTDHGDPHLPGSKLLGTLPKPSIIPRIRSLHGGPGGAGEHDIPGIWGSACEGRNRSYAALS